MASLINRFNDLLTAENREQAFENMMNALDALATFCVLHPDEEDSAMDAWQETYEYRFCGLIG